MIEVLRKLLCDLSKQVTSVMLLHVYTCNL